MGIVGEHKGDAGLPAYAYDPVKGLPLKGNVVVLYLKIEVLPEKLIKLQRSGLGTLVIPLHYALGYLPRKAAGKADKPLRVLMEKLPVYSGLHVKALGIACGHKVAEVFVARLIFAQKHKVGILIVRAVGLFSHASGGNIHLAAGDGLYARRLAGLIKGHGAVHNAVVGDGNGILTQCLQALGEPVNAAGPVQQGKLGMQMQMNKAHISLLFSFGR